MRDLVYALVQILDKLDFNFFIFLFIELCYPVSEEDLLNGFHYNLYCDYLTWPKTKRQTCQHFYYTDWIWYFDVMYLVNNFFEPFQTIVLAKRNHQIFIFFFTCFNYYILCVWYFLIFMFVYKLIISDLLKTYNISFPEYFYFEYEQNIGDGECLYMLLSFVLAVLFLSLIYLFVDTTFLHFQIVIFLLVLTFIIIPIRIVIAFGVCFIKYLKGAASTDKILSTAFVDAITMAAFFARFMIQSVRIILVYGFYFAIHEYVFVLPKDYITNILTEDFLLFYSWFYYNLVVLRWLIELVDSTVSICNQLASFFLSFFDYLPILILVKKKNSIILVSKN